MSRRTDLHIRYLDGAFHVYDGEAWAEELASEADAHARLAVLRRTRVRHVSALVGRDHITHATQDGIRTLCGRVCKDWQREEAPGLDSPADCLVCSRKQAEL